MDGVVVHAERGQRRQLQKRAARIEQPHDPFSRKKFSARYVALAGALWAAFSRLSTARLQFLGERTHTRGVGGKLRRTRIDR
jgi:hypothetical protein